jgi:hypothetical protein
MYITLIFNECFAQQNSMFSNYCSILFVFTPTLISLSFFFFFACKQYSFSNDYFSLHYLICTTRVCLIKFLISNFVMSKFWQLFSILFTLENNNSKIFPNLLVDKICPEGKKKICVTRNTHLSDFCFCKQHIHFNVLISFWKSTIYNTQLTVI